MTENKRSALDSWKTWRQLLMAVSLVGIIDAGYLAFKNFTYGVVPCSISGGCADVLTSQYSTVYGVPTAVFGLIFYLSIFVLTYALFYRKKLKTFTYLFWLSVSGFLVSMYLVYVQLFVLKAICLYCMLSALLSIGIFTLVIVFRFSQDSPLKQKSKE